MIQMIEFFMAQIREKGDQGLPVWMEEYDPSDPEEEWAYQQKVMAAYEQKPENYEEILKVQLHDGTFNRRKKFSKRKSRKQEEPSSDSDEGACSNQYSFQYSGLPTESSQETEEEVTFNPATDLLISF